VRVWTGFIWFRIGSCESGDETSVFIKDGGFLDQLREYPLLKKDSSTWN